MRGTRNRGENRESLLIITGIDVKKVVGRACYINPTSILSYIICSECTLTWEREKSSKEIRSAEGTL